MARLDGSRSALKHERNERRPHATDGKSPRAFPLVLYYTLASIVVIAVALAAVIFVSSETERRSVISRLEQESDLEARLIAFDLAERLSLQSTSGEGLETGFLKDRDATHRAVLNSIRGRPIVRADILDARGRIVYSTDRHASAGLAGMPTELMSAIDVGSVSRYSVGHEITLSNGAVGTFDVVESLVPIFPETAANETEVRPYAVFAIYHDVTESVEAATVGVERMRLLSVGGTMAALFLVLLGVVIQGERAISRSNRRLAVALDKERDLRQRVDEQNHQLTEANEAKIRFLSVVSHELKTPLTGIVAFADILKLNRAGNLTEKQVEQLAIIQRNGRRLDSLVNDLLDLSRIDRGNFELNRQRFDVTGMLSESLVSLEGLLSAKGQELTATIPDKALEICGDRERLSQVVANLMSNASKYSPEKSRISLNAYQGGDRLYVAVRDQGIGISAEDQPRLFSEFFRVQSAQTRDIPGTGLGLAIVKSLVERHGGSITVESSPGSGSTFTFWVPVGAGA